MGAIVPREKIPSYEQPLLGLTVGQEAWILALPKGHLKKGFEALTDPTAVEGYMGPRERVRFADELHSFDPVDLGGARHRCDPPSGSCL